MGPCGKSVCRKQKKLFGKVSKRIIRVSTAAKSHLAGIEYRNASLGWLLSYLQLLELCRVSGILIFQQISLKRILFDQKYGFTWILSCKILCLTWEANLWRIEIPATKSSQSFRNCEIVGLVLLIQFLRSLLLQNYNKMAGQGGKVERSAVRNVVWYKEVIDIKSKHCQRHNRPKAFSL